jgi:hypothetical protein
LPICNAETSVDNPNAEVAIIVHVSIRKRSANLGFDQIILADFGQWGLN